MADRLTFLGHSTVVVDLDGVRVLTDPLLGHLAVAIRRQVPAVRRRHARGPLGGLHQPRSPGPSGSRVPAGSPGRPGVHRPGRPRARRREGGSRSRPRDAGRRPAAGRRSDAGGRPRRARPPPLALHVGGRPAGSALDRVDERLLCRRYGSLPGNVASWPDVSTWRSCRSAAGAQDWDAAIWIRGMPPRQQCESALRSPRPSTGARSTRSACGDLAGRRFDGPGEAFREAVAARAAGIDVRVLRPGQSMPLDGRAGR